MSKLLSRNQILSLTLITLVFYLPFASKGVSYDDLVFLDYAKRLTKNPARCVVDDYFFLGMELKDLVVFESTHPPLVPYVQKVVIFLFGESLLMLHLAMYGFLLLATLVLAALIARYSRYSPLLALGLTLGPMFLPNATSLMTDTALFALWFGTLLCWEHTLDLPANKFRPMLLLTAAFACGAYFTAYQGLGLLVLLPLVAMLRGRTRHGLLVVGLSLIPFLLWIWLVWRNYHILAYFVPPRVESSIANEVHKGLVWANISLKGRAVIFYLGAASIFFVPWFLRGQQGVLSFVAACGWGLALTAYLFPDQSLWFTLYASVLGGCGLLALLPLLKAGRDVLVGGPETRHVSLVLLCCAGGFLVFQVLLASFAAPRYSMVTMGAILLLALHSRPHAQLKPPMWVLLPTLLLGLAVAYAEKEYADAQRIDLLPLPKETIYVAGEKGLHYNGAKAGYHYFLPTRTEDVHYLLVPEEFDHVRVPEALLDYAELVDQFTLTSPLPIRVMDRSSEAGFYINNRGMLPFVFSNEPIDTLRLYKIFHPGHLSWLSKASHSVPAGAVTADTPLTQDFPCERDGLTAFRLMFATYARSNASSLTVSLSELENGVAGAVVFSETLAAASLVDNAWRRFDFPGLSSKNKNYRLTLESPDASVFSAVTVWSNSNADGHFRLGDQEKPGALGFETLCAPGSGSDNAAGK